MEGPAAEVEEDGRVVVEEIGPEEEVTEPLVEEEEALELEMRDEEVLVGTVGRDVGDPVPVPVPLPIGREVLPAGYGGRTDEVVMNDEVVG